LFYKLLIYQVFNEFISSKRLTFSLLSSLKPLIYQWLIGIMNVRRAFFSTSDVHY